MLFGVLANGIPPIRKIFYMNSMLSKFSNLLEMHSLLALTIPSQCLAMIWEDS